MAFCYLQQDLVINMVEIMDTATKTGIAAGKTKSKRVVQKTAEDTGNLTGNKIADKNISAGKTNKNTKDTSAK